MNLRIVAVRANYLHNKNKLNNKKKRKKTKNEKINNIYMSDKQRYLKS